MRKKWTWFETYQLAKSTAVSQVISVKHMHEKLAQECVASDFSPQEATIIREAKSKTALQFLAGNQTNPKCWDYPSRTRFAKTDGGSGLA